jgi:hypothetical protein
MSTQTRSEEKRKAPVLPELNPFYRLTNEDHMIFRRRRVPVAIQGAYHKADRRDYFAMCSCGVDREAIDDMATVGISRKVAVRTHQGYLAFRGLV